VRVRGRLFVLGQGVLFVVLALAPLWAREWDVPAWVTVVGGVLLLAGLGGSAVALHGLGEALTPVPEPRMGASLVESGPYRWVRHPIYTGVLATAAGWTVVWPSWWTVAATVLLVGLLSAKARYEEGLLRSRYPGYADYARRTPRFVPRPWG
jgi:protein-S-isoprenylcysteine O-methyltransferase Ste14